MNYMYNFSNVKPLLSLPGSTHWYLWCNSYFRCCCFLLDIILVRLFTSIFSLSHTQTHTNTVINNLAGCVWQSMYCWLTAGFEWWQKVNSPSADTFDIDDESNRVDRVSFYVRECHFQTLVWKIRENLWLQSPSWAPTYSQSTCVQVISI